MAKLLATDGEGERLGRFELVAELASGGMATVFLARLSGVAGFQRLVAIKRLHPHLAKEPEFVEMFLDEARLAARIHHPNVVPIQEVGHSPQGYYLVMDYVEGDTLARLLARAAQNKVRVPWGVTIRIVLDTLGGLHAAHELTDDFGVPLSIVHRDVSPQNILVGSDGIARITDFGVARAASRLSTTRSGQLKGKLAYMAPEQARGDDIDRRADVFSSGIVLWEALALKRLFKGEGEAQTLNRVLYEPIAPPSTHRPDVPPELERICMKALERDVEQRFRSCAELADELERAARRVAFVASAKDVATCLESVFGDELSTQRDAVRAWLTRSEPSAAGSARRSLLPESAKTRIEGKSEPSRTAPLSPSQPPEKVSSLSSATLQADPSLRPRSSKARSLVAVAGITCLVALAFGGGVWLTTRSKAGVTSAATLALPASTVRDAPTASMAPTTSAVAKPPVAEEPTVPVPSPSASARRPGPRRPTNVAPAGRPSGTAVAAPDDLSKNPYR